MSDQVTHRESIHFTSSAKHHTDEKSEVGENNDDYDDEDNCAHYKNAKLGIKRFSLLDTTSESSEAAHTHDEKPDESAPRNMRGSCDESLPRSFIREPSCVSLSMTSEIVPSLSTRANEVPPESTQGLIEKSYSPNVIHTFGTSQAPHDMQEEELEHVFQAFSTIPTHTVSNGIESENMEVTVSKSFHDNAPDNRGTSVYSERIRKRRKNPLADLYYRGIKRKKKLDENLEAIREAQTRDLENCTFKPIITKRGRLIRHCSTRSGYYKHNTQLRQRLLLEAWRSETTEECRPIPVISKGSENIVRRVRGGSAPVLPASERLYLDSARRQCRIGEEDTTQKKPVVVRTLDDVKAHVDGLYLYEERRKLALQKLREEMEKSTSQESLHVNTKDVVKRLTQDRAKAKYDPLEKGDVSFKPKLSSTTNALILCARRRRLEKWYHFWCKHENSKELPQCAIFEKIRDALQGKTFPDGLSLDIFCNTLEKFEKIHGTQLWHSILPPSEPYLNKELTFAPKINPYKREESSSSIHQRLFQVAKTKQITSKRKEQMQREAEFLAEEKRRKKLQVWSARNSKVKERTENVDVKMSLTPFLRRELAQNADFSCGVGSPSLSQLSSSSSSFSSGQIETTFTTKSVPEKCAFLKLLNAADDLRNLIDEPNEIDIHYSPSPPSNLDSLQVEINPQPHSFTSTVEIAIEVETDSAVLSVLPPKQKKPQRLTDIQVSTDILLECALSRRTWSADVSTRKQQECENRRRLKEVGKVLYQMM
ncbi:hypothetical protein LSM04_004787 [Trypanosoma melophagium]|uniref:uncharacterized protein n=1 Tax=Trypanosoma melophagium TaxID=715481 RepID=UPI00351A3EE9|nr:hypothetical protein LSM04_004787 [Trypanosoma melophagium]